MGVPLLDLKAQYEALKPQFDEAVQSVLSTQHFIGGPHVAALESETADYLGVHKTIGCASGSDALMLALWALGVEPGDEVITTPFTFFATAGAISRLGGVPVFVDINPDTFNIDPTAIEAAIGPRTVGILPVHLFGVPADMEAICRLAEEHGLFVVEDAAQSIGALVDGKQTGTLGDAGCFSFFPSKNLGAWGDGGLVSTRREDLGVTIARLRSHGNHPKKYFHAIVGCNSRLDALQAAVLRIKLKHLNSWCEARRERLATYRSMVVDAGLSDRVTFQTVPDGVVPVFHQCVIRVDNRDAVTESMKEAGVGTAVYYPLALHLQECYADLGYTPGQIPEAERATQEVMALPIFPELTEEQQAEVVAALKTAVGG